MRYPSLLRTLAFVVFVSVSGTAFAQFDPFLAELAAARRELVAAKLEARYYWQVEYQRARRELNAAITFADAEVRTLRRRLRDYEPFNRFSTGAPLSVTYQDLKLCILDSELRLRALRDERNNLVRFHSDQFALLELRVADARARVVELEGGEMIEIETVRELP